MNVSVFFGAPLFVTPPVFAESFVLRVYRQCFGWQKQLKRVFRLGRYQMCWLCVGVLGARGFPNTVSGSSTAEVTFLPTLLQTFSCYLLVLF